MTADIFKMNPSIFRNSKVAVFSSSDRKMDRIFGFSSGWGWFPGCGLKTRWETAEQSRFRFLEFYIFLQHPTFATFLANQDLWLSETKFGFYPEYRSRPWIISKFRRFSTSRKNNNLKRLANDHIFLLQLSLENLIFINYEILKVALWDICEIREIIFFLNFEKLSEFSYICIFWP